MDGGSLLAHAISGRGAYHHVNQDSYYFDRDRGLFIIADGMGGHRAGEVASRLAVEVLSKTLTSSEDFSKEALVKALLTTHRIILGESEREKAYHGMGTTALIAWVKLPELKLLVAHVGDSRAYLWRKGSLQPLTEDHTLFNELRKANRLPSDPSLWPSRSILTQSLGAGQALISPSIGELFLEFGDRLLLCTDGVWDLLREEEMNQILSEASTPEDACNRIAHMVKNRGAWDDFTAIVILVGKT
ncbi:MAG: PP2C family protein-serine/threonine phosphatase [Aquificaceae bacterium]